MTKKLSERDKAIALANKVLEDASLDPDDDLSMMSRQFLRAREIVEKQEKALQEMDWQGKATEDLINANRDQMLKMHEEAVRRIRKVLDATGHYDARLSDITLDKVAKIREIADALNTFHPMHSESWCGWPEGSE